MLEKINKFLIPISIVVAGLIIAGAFIYINQGQTQISSKGQLSAQEVADKAIKYINENFPGVNNSASLMSVSEEGGIYKIHLKVGETEYDSYATKDGKLFFPEGYSLEEGIGEGATSGNTSVEAPKWDKPDVKLFVMSYCPYGLQGQKMFLPVYDLLKDKADMGVYFVNYIMHGKEELDENLRQYCIQREEKEKYSSYLSCFVKSGDSEECFSEAKINREKIENCILETDQEFNITSLYNDQTTWLNGTNPRFDVHTTLNTKYGIQGSPTVVINDTVVSVSPRSPEKFKEVICQAFNSPPEECSQNLSNDVPSPGIGEGTSSSGSGSCQ